WPASTIENIACFGRLVYDRFAQPWADATVLLERLSQICPGSLLILPHLHGMLMHLKINELCHVISVFVIILFIIVRLDLAIKPNMRL
ncbi:MAG: hypothetical protein K9N55_16445, partial [Phycisphaerae bacterium]|nr:hypothetical protein [Phycisphaerae bacterium]